MNFAFFFRNSYSFVVVISPYCCFCLFVVSLEHRRDATHRHIKQDKSSNIIENKIEVINKQIEFVNNLEELINSEIERIRKLE